MRDEGVATPVPTHAAEPFRWRLSVALRLHRDGPEVLREPVAESDLIDALAECWLAAVLRKGRSHLPMEALRPQVVPLFSKSGAACVGYSMAVTAPDGHEGRRDFTIRSLEAVAARGAQRLIARGDLGRGDVYYYDVVAERAPAPPAETASRQPAIEGSARVRPIAALDLPLAPLLERSRSIGPPDDDDVKVFYTEESLARAEGLARRGAGMSPPVETGGVLIGSLARCPESNDVFVLVLDVLEAADADQREFSLYYSSRTWGHIQAVMKAMQSRPATSTYRIVGQCHGHNFLPANGETRCEACDLLAVCGRTSVFVSNDDLNWTRAVFRRQPWTLSHIFGLNARREEVQGLFGLRDGRLLERGFRVIPAVEMEGGKDAEKVSEATRDGDS